MGHSRTRKIQDHHHSLLQRGHGKRGVVMGRVVRWFDWGHDERNESNKWTRFERGCGIYASCWFIPLGFIGVWFLFTIGNRVGLYHRVHKV